MSLPCRSFELLPPCVLWCPGDPEPRGEKLTSLCGHLTRRRITVYLVKSHSHPQVANRILTARVGIHVDLGIMGNHTLMACHSTEATPLPATYGCCAATLRASTSPAPSESPRGNHCGADTGVASVRLRRWTSRTPPRRF